MLSLRMTGLCTCYNLTDWYAAERWWYWWYVASTRCLPFITTWIRSLTHMWKICERHTDEPLMAFCHRAKRVSRFTSCALIALVAVFVGPTHSLCTAHGDCLTSRVLCESVVAAASARRVWNALSLSRSLSSVIWTPDYSRSLADYRSHVKWMSIEHDEQTPLDHRCSIVWAIINYSWQCVLSRVIIDRTIIYIYSSLQLWFMTDWFRCGDVNHFRVRMFNAWTNLKHVLSRMSRLCRW